MCMHAVCILASYWWQWLVKVGVHVVTLIHLPIKLEHNGSLKPLPPQKEICISNIILNGKLWLMIDTL